MKGEVVKFILWEGLRREERPPEPHAHCVSQGTGLSKRGARGKLVPCGQPGSGEIDRNCRAKLFDV